MPPVAPWLPSVTLALVDAGVAGLEATFAERLAAAALVGAAASPVRHDRARAPEILAVVRAVEVEDLSALAARVGKAMRRGLRIRVLTEEELRTSCDVFALEAAEWRDRHVLLAGDDPFTALAIRDADLRRALEQAVRGLGRQLRNRILSAEATDGRRGDVQLALSIALERLVEIAHHALRLAGEDVPAEEDALLEAFARWIDADPVPVAARLAELRSVGELDDPWATCRALVPFLDAAKRAIDGLGAAP